MRLLLQARPLIQQVADDGNLQTLVDPRLGTDFDPSIMMRMVECAAAAVRQSALHRPSMVQVRSFSDHSPPPVMSSNSNACGLLKFDMMLMCSADP
jgi:hypothetical protein